MCVKINLVKWFIAFRTFWVIFYHSENVPIDVHAVFNFTSWHPAEIFRHVCLPGGIWESKERRRGDRRKQENGEKNSFWFPESVPTEEGKVAITNHWTSFYTFLPLKQCFIEMQHSKANTRLASSWGKSHVRSHTFMSFQCQHIVKLLHTGVFIHTLCRDYVVTKTIIVLCNEWNKDHYIQVNIIIRTNYVWYEIPASIY